MWENEFYKKLFGMLARVDKDLEDAEDCIVGLRDENIDDEFGLKVCATLMHLNMLYSCLQEEGKSDTKMQTIARAKVIDAYLRLAIVAIPILKEKAKSNGEIDIYMLYVLGNEAIREKEEAESLTAASA